MRRLTDYESFRENPFTLEKDMQYFTIGAISRGHLLDKDTGEVEEHNKYQTLDKKPYVKMFKEAIPIIQDLKHKAQRVLYDILLDIKKEEDEVYLNASNLAKKHGLSNTRDILSGIKELIEKDVICKKAEKDMYFVNVRYIFSGSRVKYSDRKK